MRYAEERSATNSATSKRKLVSGETAELKPKIENDGNCYGVVSLVE